MRARWPRTKGTEVDGRRSLRSRLEPPCCLASFWSQPRFGRCSGPEAGPPGSSRCTPPRPRAHPAPPPGRTRPHGPGKSDFSRPRV